MMMRTIILSLILMLAGCGNGNDAGKELEAKSEYSVLQGLEYDYRQREQDKPYVVEKNAFSSGYDLIGVPKGGSKQGYVWLIANPSSAPAIKQMPKEADFSINKDDFAAIEKSALLTPAVRSYLAAHVEP